MKLFRAKSATASRKKPGLREDPALLWGNILMPVKRDGRNSVIPF